MTIRPEPLDPDDKEAAAIPEEHSASQGSSDFARLVELVWSQVSDSPDARSSPSTLDRVDALPKIGRFVIERELGRGGGGVVFLATDPNLERKVALKLPNLHAILSPHECKRFFREGKAAAGLRHPNIVTVFEAHEAGSLPYLSMEYCEDGSLADWLKARDPAEPVDCRLAAEMTGQIAEAVRHAHERGVLHRDLKPGNILLQATGRKSSGSGLDFELKVADFGLAKIEDDERSASSEGHPLGTLRYMSPEASTGDRDSIGPATDVYGLGLILFELLTGRGPFLAESRGEALRQIRETPAPSPRDFREDIPLALERICSKCLEKNPSRRYAGPGQVAVDLRLFLEARSGPVAPFRTSTQNTSRTRRVKTFDVVRLTALAVATLAGMAMIAGRLIPPGESRSEGLTQPLPQVLPGPGVEAILNADPVDLANRTNQTEQLGPGLQARLRQSLAPTKPSSQEGDVRRANAACALLLLDGNDSAAWDLLKYQSDPQARSFLIQRLDKAGVAPELVLARLETEPDAGVRQALILALGESSRLSTTSTEAALAKAFDLYEQDPDPGVHGACKWLILRQGLRDKLSTLDTRLAALPSTKGRRWRVGPTGLTFVTIRHPSTGREFEITDSEISVRQFLKFRPEHVYDHKECPDAEAPINMINAVVAAEYCNWLSRSEHIDESGLAYIGSANRLLAAVEKFEESEGYRLPNGEEFERACRAGTTTIRYFGTSDDLLPAHAWFGRPYSVLLHPSCELKPNAFGLFDMLGNADEVCQGVESSVPAFRSQVCGGSVLYDAASIRSDLNRGPISVTERSSLSHTFGFRVVRTLPGRRAAGR